MCALSGIRLYKRHIPGWQILAQFFILLFLAACGGGGGGGGSSVHTTTESGTSNPAPTTTLEGSVKGTSIYSAKTGAVYPIYVYTPSDYATTTDQLPVIYMTDGGYDADDHFTKTALMMEARGLRGIIVGIGNFARRATDYRLPGAANYYDFLTTELIPAIEPQYRVKTTTRTLVGHSYGGLFTVLSLFMDRPTKLFFANFISLDGSFWDQTDALYAMEQTTFDDSAGNLPGTRLVLSSAAFEGNDIYVEDLYQRLLARNYLGLQMTRFPAYPFGHLAMFNDAMSDSLRVVFP